MKEVESYLLFLFFNTLHKINWRISIKNNGMMRLVEPHQLFVAVEAFLEVGKTRHGGILRRQRRPASADFRREL
jgi:hypothetical protein